MAATMDFVEMGSSLRGRSTTQRAKPPVQLLTAGGGIRIGVNTGACEPATRSGADPASAAQPARALFVFVEPPLLSGVDRDGLDHLRVATISVLAVDVALVIHLAAVGLDAGAAEDDARRTRALVSAALLTNAVGAFGVVRCASVGIWLFSTAVTLQTFLLLERVLSSSQVVHHALHVLAAILASTLRQWLAHSFFRISSPSLLATPQLQGR
ncbi:hypothetical protein KFE25_010849 [Diacronema lutheri]|uniref:Uncharacterized protein n=1 Tax=Diacronema lutheri TaxID=2081491 RepID=A0A8J6C557_DIALT|nr:hypothetical protein KFE25_010849 [Diacronema lutheri]